LRISAHIRKNLAIMKTLKLALSIGLIATLTASRADATLIVTYAEHPGELNSTLINTTVDTFNSLSTGMHATADWTDPSTGAVVGTFNDLYIKGTDQYGGANNTNYAVTGLGIDTRTVLNLTQSSAYFGLWWSAGDPKNVLDFYSGANGTGTLLAEFSTANLMNKLTPKTLYPNGYYGNPNAGANYQRDSSEPFAFINFFGTSGTNWSSIVVTNNGNSGFEADNYTSRVAAYDPATDGSMPGIVLEAINGTQVTPYNNGIPQAPEPAAKWAMFFIGFLSFGGSLVRRLRK
jgi:hypothetical protein